MPKPCAVSVRKSHKVRVLILLLVYAAMACKATATPMPTLASPSANGSQTIYPTGIEVRQLNNNIILVLDHKGLYGMGFPQKWEVGAFHENFEPVIKKYSETNKAIASLYETLYQQDKSVRIYAIDTSPGHLTKETMAIIYVGMFQDPIYLHASLDELIAEYMSRLSKDPKVKVVDTLIGKSNYSIPYVILTTKTTPSNGSPVYGASVLINTQKAYLELLYLTFDSNINVVDELYPILTTISTFSE